MPTLNYSTTIAAEKTIAEITAALVKHKAQEITSTYADGSATGIRFTIATEFGPRQFAISPDVEAVHRLLVIQARSNSRVKATTDQARRVAWRVMKDWITAQLAMVEARLAPLDRMLLPYVVADASTGVTLYEAYAASGRAALEQG